MALVNRKKKKKFDPQKLRDLRKDVEAAEAKLEQVEHSGPSTLPPMAVVSALEAPLEATPETPATPQPEIRRFPREKKSQPPAVDEKLPPGRPPLPRCAKCGHKMRHCTCSRPAEAVTTMKPADASVLVLDEATVKYLIQLVGQFNTMAVSLTQKMSAADAGEIWMFSPQEMAALTPCSTKVLNKNLPAWLLRFQDEFALVIVLLPILIAKMAMTMAWKEAQKEGGRRPAEPQPSVSKPNGSGVEVKAV